MPVLLRVFPQGLDSRDAQQAARLREAYEHWLERGAKQPSVHHTWIRHVLHELLGYPEGWLAEGQALPPGIEAVMANVGEVLRPDIVLKRADGDEKPVLLVGLYPPEQDLEKPISGKLWNPALGNSSSNTGHLHRDSHTPIHRPLIRTNIFPRRTFLIIVPPLALRVIRRNAIGDIFSSSPNFRLNEDRLRYPVACATEATLSLLFANRLLARLTLVRCKC